MIFAWQQNQWQQLQRAKLENRLPHALLLSGVAGIGKAAFAHTFTRALLCTHSKEMPCGECHSCRLIDGKTHPNVVWLEPEKEGQAIKIDEVREAIQFIQHSSLQGEYRILIIHPADKMNLNAANALLKTLEEPASGSLIILISHQVASLPATIRSRCQRMTFPVPLKADALAWLQPLIANKNMNAELLLTYAKGAPFKALQLVEGNELALRSQTFDVLHLLALKKADPIHCAEMLKEIESLPFVDLVLSWTSDVLRLQLQTNDIVNQDYQAEIITISQQYAFSFIKNFLDYVLQVRAELCSVIHLNKQLLIEDIFIRWMMQSCFEMQEGKLC